MTIMKGRAGETLEYSGGKNEIALRRAGILPLLLLSILALGSKSLPEGDEFGEGVRMREVTPIKEILKSPESFAGKTILLSGRISDVCQRKGCWTVLSDGDLTMRVRFKDYGFFLPTDSSGRQAFVEGVVKVQTLSQSDARHYESESVGGDPSKIVGPQHEVGFTASGVRLIARTPAAK